jgi:hypothetical protein
MDENIISEYIAAGDSYLLHNVLPSDLATEDTFNLLLNEICWKEQINKGGVVPRLLSYQGDIIDGCIPLYRVPTDIIQATNQFTGTVRIIKEHVERAANQSFNHCLIQLYRSGHDYISKHADKTLDIARGSKIVNLSMGATRRMKISSKSDRSAIKSTELVILPHNSLFVLGWQSNLQFLHAIKQDKRMESQKSDEELMFGCQRISFTFRQVATFQRPDKHLFGKGAYCKTAAELDTALINGTYDSKRQDDSHQSLDMIRAFSLENRSSLFDWDLHYGIGFDIFKICAD